MSHRGIKANTEKIRAVMEIKSPQTVKEVQSLTGKMAVLNRFISRLRINAIFSSKLLRKEEKWSGQLKEYLNS